MHSIANSNSRARLDGKNRFSSVTNPRTTSLRSYDFSDANMQYQVPADAIPTMSQAACVSVMFSVFSFRSQTAQQLSTAIAGRCVLCPQPTVRFDGHHWD